jgi:hypothetical protein
MLHVGLEASELLKIFDNMQGYEDRTKCFQKFIMRKLNESQKPILQSEAVNEKDFFINL